MMRSLLVARAAAHVAEIGEVLRREGFDIVVASPPLAVESALGFSAVFLDSADGEAETLATLGTLRGLEALQESPFVAVLGIPPRDDLATEYVRAGAQTCLPADTKEFAWRMRFITNAIQARASLSAAMRELRVTEERWRVALGALDEGLLIQASDGRVTTMNPAAARILGMTDQEVHDRSWRHADWVARTVDGRRIGPEEFPGAVALRERRPVLGQVLCLTSPRGHTVWVSVNAHPILEPTADASTAVVSTIRDLTDQRRLEMHLMATERLSSLGRLAASVGHELNNPLTYVLGGIDGVTKRLRAQGMEEDADMLDEAMDGAQRIRGIVRDLRVFSTREPDALSAVDVRRVVESCTRMAMAEIRPRARLVCSFGDTPRAHANEARLAQIVLNLLVNAAQAIREGEPHGNVVSVETRREPDGRVAIVVRDTGVGIAPAHLPLVLEPFFTTKADSGGTGLGLSICQMLATAQGGELRIASPSSGGTEVTVLLHAAPDDARKTSSDHAAVRPSAAHRILVVDDEPQIARLIADCLEGCHVTLAKGGREAIDLLGGDRAFDAVVCDLMMPDTTGVDVHAFVQTSRPSLEPHMLFITGGAYTPRALAFVAQVEARCLEKPFTPNAIVVGVERAVKGFRASAP
jgi:PAS domain S-box-containing protein